MEDLRSAVDALAGVEVAALDAGTLGTELVELRVQIDRLEAQWLARLAAFDDDCGPMVDGAATTAAWLRRDCRLAPGAARERVTVARRLRELPATANSLAEGAISYRHFRPHRQRDRGPAGDCERLGIDRKHPAGGVPRV